MGGSGAGGRSARWAVGRKPAGGAITRAGPGRGDAVSRAARGVAGGLAMSTHAAPSSSCLTSQAPPPSRLPLPPLAPPPCPPPCRQRVPRWVHSVRKLTPLPNVHRCARAGAAPRGGPGGRGGGKSPVLPCARPPAYQAPCMHPPCPPPPPPPPPHHDHQLAQPHATYTTLTTQGAIYWSKLDRVYYGADNEDVVSRQKAPQGVERRAARGGGACGAPGSMEHQGGEARSGPARAAPRPATRSPCALMPPPADVHACTPWQIRARVFDGSGDYTKVRRARAF